MIEIGWRLVHLLHSAFHHLQIFSLQNLGVQIQSKGLKVQLVQGPPSSNLCVFLLPRRTKHLHWK